MIAVRLLDGTAIYASKYRMKNGTLSVGELKFVTEDAPAYIEDSTLISMDSVGAFAILHIGGKNE